MLIDYLTQRFCFSDAGFLLTAACYLLAPAVALFLHRQGQFQAKKKQPQCGSLKDSLLEQLGGDLWKIIFFFVTGCLYPTYRLGSTELSPIIKRKIFWGGLRTTLYATAAFYTLYTAFQFAESRTGSVVFWVLLLVTKALTCANLSLLIFTLIPIPGSEIETLLRKKPFSEKGIAFRQNGTMPFFVYCVIGLLLACIELPLFNGQVCSLSGIITLFPVLVIGG